MRFTVAWANVVSENGVLKLALGCLTVVLVGLSAVTVRLEARQPLVIERACYSRVLPVFNEERTPAEIEAFVREALASRFDTLAQVHPGFLSQAEEGFREQEQQELQKRGISQHLVINTITVSGEKVTVDADRLFSVGTVRSALPFPLVLTLGTLARTEGNPYGLSLMQVSAPPTGQPPGGASR